MKILAALAIWGASWTIPGALEAQISSGRPIVYVAEFTSDTKVEPRLLNSITEDFETLLTTSSFYTVLERRRYGALLAEVRREADLTGRPAAVDQLKRHGADAVFFGRVEEDVADGSYVFYVTLDKLDRTIIWKRHASLQRGLVNRRDSRIAALKRILEGKGQIEADNIDWPSRIVTSRAAVQDALVDLDRHMRTMAVKMISGVREPQQASTHMAAFMASLTSALGKQEDWKIAINQALHRLKDAEDINKYSSGVTALSAGLRHFAAVNEGIGKIGGAVADQTSQRGQLIKDAMTAAMSNLDNGQSLVQQGDLMLANAITTYPIQRLSSGPTQK